MTVCFEAKGFSSEESGPCFENRRVGVVQCPGEDGPLLWRLPYAPNTWGPSGDCTYGYCTNGTNSGGGYGGRGFHNAP